MVNIVGEGEKSFVEKVTSVAKEQGEEKFILGSVVIGGDENSKLIKELATGNGLASLSAKEIISSIRPIIEEGKMALIHNNRNGKLMTVEVNEEGAIKTTVSDRQNKMISESGITSGGKIVDKVSFRNEKLAIDDEVHLGDYHGEDGGDRARSVNKAIRAMLKMHKDKCAGAAI